MNAKPAAKAPPVPPKAPKGEPLRPDPVPTGSIGASDVGDGR